MASGARTLAAAWAVLCLCPALAGESLLCSFTNQQGNPLKDVEARIVDPAHGTAETRPEDYAKSDNKGLLGFHDLKAGRYLLQAQKKGYFPLQMLVDVPGGGRLDRTLMRDKEFERGERQAVKALESGDSAAAVAGFEALAEFYPRDAALRDNLARAYATVPNKERALAEAALAARIDPSFEAAAIEVERIAYRVTGETALREYDFKEALANFEALQRVDPDSRDAFYGLALTYGHMGRLAEALAAIDQAIAIAPEDPDLARVKGMLEHNAAR